MVDAVLAGLSSSDEAKEAAKAVKYSGGSVNEAEALKWVTINPARQLHIEGDVTLQVKFTAEGQVQVLQVLNGLGHGLDEQARVVAEGIRFKPATKDGHAVDEVTIIRVTFQLA